MKILTIHSDYLEYEAKKKAIDSAPEPEKKQERIEECLVVFQGSEEIDEENPEEIAEKTVEEIKEILEKVNTDKVVLYPFVHLTENPSSPSTAQKILEKERKIFKETDLEVHSSPFGWYKAFNVKCKGHPLAELSRKIVPEEETEEGQLEAVEEEGEFEGMKIIKKSGEIIEREEVEDEKVKIAIKDELGELETEGGKPPHIDLMREHELVGRENRVSDAGNLRYYPKGKLIVDLMMNLGERVCTRELNGVKTKTPCIINPNQESVKIMMEKFPERLYKVLPPSEKKDQEFRLRPACDYGAWSMMKDMIISYKQLPFGLYEHERSWRYEQRGELVGLNRTRAFTMANFHTMCKDLEEAFDEFERQVNKFAIKFYEYFGIDPEVIVLNCKRNFFEEHKGTFKKWASSFDMPIIISLFKEMKTYKVAWVDVIAFDTLNRPVEVDTVQLDTKSPEWWDITYTDKQGEEQYPLILHTGFGPERFLSALLEDASGKEKPMLPIWLSPTQVRLVPVSDESLDYVEEVAKKLEKSDIRVDIDEEDESVGKKIRRAEKEWIPVTVVIGPDEEESRVFKPRLRKENKEKEMSLEEIQNYILEKTAGYPYKPLPLPRKLSKRPKFRG